MLGVGWGQQSKTESVLGSTVEKNRQRQAGRQRCPGRAQPAPRRLQLPAESHPSHQSWHRTHGVTRATPPLTELSSSSWSTSRCWASWRFSFTSMASLIKSRRIDTPLALLTNGCLKHKRRQFTRGPKRCLAHQRRLITFAESMNLIFPFLFGMNRREITHFTAPTREAFSGLLVFFSLAAESPPSLAAKPTTSRQGGTAP